MAMRVWEKDLEDDCRGRECPASFACTVVAVQTGNISAERALLAVLALEDYS